jgi:uracil-DNA glycosylase
MPRVELVLLVGSYAQARYLADARAETMTATVAAWRDHAPRYIPLPHPSWRNTGWLKKNPWFTRELLPSLRQRVHGLLDSSPAASASIASMSSSDKPK